MIYVTIWIKLILKIKYKNTEINHYKLFYIKNNMVKYGNKYKFIQKGGIKIRFK